MTYIEGLVVLNVVEERPASVGKGDKLLRSQTSIPPCSERQGLAHIINHKRGLQGSNFA